MLQGINRAIGETMTIHEVLEANTCPCGGNLESDGDGLVCNKCGLRIVQLKY
jgi:tRNA(Ile2) C34 agmatinyltransferase TiaS